MGELCRRCSDVLEFDQVRKLAAEVVSQLAPLGHVLRTGTAQLGACAGSGQPLRAWLYAICRALALWTAAQYSTPAAGPPNVSFGAGDLVSQPYY